MAEEENNPAEEQPTEGEAQPTKKDRGAAKLLGGLVGLIARAPPSR